MSGSESNPVKPGKTLQLRSSKIGKYIAYCHSVAVNNGSRYLTCSANSSATKPLCLAGDHKGLQDHPCRWMWKLGIHALEPRSFPPLPTSLRSLLHKKNMILTRFCGTLTAQRLNQGSISCSYVQELLCSFSHRGRLTLDVALALTLALFQLFFNTTRRAMALAIGAYLFLGLLFGIPRLAFPRFILPH